MTETAIHEELQNIIEKSVDQSVDRANIPTCAV